MIPMHSITWNKQALTGKSGFWTYKLSFTCKTKLTGLGLKRSKQQVEVLLKHFSCCVNMVFFFFFNCPYSILLKSLFHKVASSPISCVNSALHLLKVITKQALQKCLVLLEVDGGGNNPMILFACSVLYTSLRQILSKLVLENLPQWLSDPAFSPWTSC